ncbi:MAG: sulfatase-like hydrolase/transferase [Pseudomonadota bacterium]
MRPNIILITSDQHRGDCFGFEQRKVKTPHIDSMAVNGTRFSACTTPNAVCMPARASILSGLFPRTCGVLDNGYDLTVPIAKEYGFANRMAKAGYKTALIGKAHLRHGKYKAGPDGPRGDERRGQDWSGPYMGFDHVELIQHNHHNTDMPRPPDGFHYERFFFQDGCGEERLARWDTRLEPDCGFNQVWHSALPPAYHTSSWCANRTINYINERKLDAEPFVLWTSMPDPHTPFDAPEPWSRMYDPEEVDLPPFRVEDFDRRPFWHRASRENDPTEPDPVMRYMRVNWSRPRNLPDDILRAVTANYYGMISLIDHNVGRILAHLDTIGMADNTVVIFTSDHGDWLGDHGLMLKGPMLYDGLVRVGLVMRGPGIARGNVVERPVSTIDLGATFYDWAGMEAPPIAHGQSLAKLLSGQDETRDFSRTEWDLGTQRCGVAVNLSSVRTPTLKLTVDSLSGLGELYDLAEDPYETTNRFDDPAYRKKQRELTDMINSRPNDAYSLVPDAAYAV